MIVFASANHAPRGNPPFGILPQHGHFRQIYLSDSIRATAEADPVAKGDVNAVNVLTAFNESSRH